MTNILFNSKKLLLSKFPKELTSLLDSTWNSIEWFPSKTNTNSYVEFIPGSNLVYVYNKCNRLSDAGRYYYIIRAFGNYLYSKLDDVTKNIWIKKLMLPSSLHINVTRIKIENSCAGQSFQSIVRDLRTPNERLVALNIVNSYIANKITLKQLKGIDIIEHPLTSAYCNFRVYHSVLPIISPYIPYYVIDEFGSALAEYITNDLKIASHTDTIHNLESIIKKMIQKI